MASQIGIMNGALSLLGEPRTDSFESSDSWVTRIRDVWDSNRNSLFEDYNWDFAVKFAQLGAASTDELGWDYGFERPSDCRRIIRVQDDTCPDNYGIEYDIRGGKILTNSETTYLRYVSSDWNEKYGHWSEKFGRLLSAMLADEVYPVTDEKDGTRNRINTALKERMRDAKSLAAFEGPPQRPKPARINTARRHATGRAGWRV